MGVNWPIVRLGDVVDLVSGFPFSSKRYTSDTGEIPLIRGDNVVQGALRWDGVKRWPKGETQGLDAYWLKRDDVLVAMDRPWIEAGLKYASISDTDLPALLVQRVSRLRGSERLLTSFLKYVIGSKAFTDYVLAIQTGTGVPHISGGQIRAFEFALPPLPEQRAIADVLGVLDDKAAANLAISAAADRYAAGLFQALHLEEPTWVALADVANLTMGSSPPGSTYNDESVGLPFFQGSRDFGRRFPKVRVWCSAPVRVAYAGDILVSVRAPVGEVNRAREDSCIGRGVAAAAALTAPTLLWYSLRSVISAWAPFNSEGTVFGTINKQDMRALRVPWLGGRRVLGFEAEIGPVDAFISQLQDETDSLQRFASRLAPELVSGRIGVSANLQAA